MGVSADAFSSIVAHIAVGLNEQQLEWLQRLFIKVIKYNGYENIKVRIDWKALMIIDNIFVFLSQFLMVNTMWELIILARPCNYSVLTAVTLIVELINDLRNSLLKEEYIQTVHFFVNFLYGVLKNDVSNIFKRSNT
uniref:Uncharacterized protein n=1 Tax=Heterorhabditis bacteriophora TaxID=37862 RepID=A0A1I7WJS3_HETBA